MLFYFITVTTEDQELLSIIQKRENQSEAYETLRGQIYEKCERINAKNSYRNCIYPVSIQNDKFEFCGIFQKPIEPEKDLSPYLKEMSIPVKTVDIEECTKQHLLIRLHIAERREYIPDADEIATKLGIRNWSFSPSAESILEGNSEKAELISKAKDIYTEETLLPELERIYGSKIPEGVLGHPVHYLICCDDKDNREQIYKILLEALNASGRLKSRRFCCVDISPEERIQSTSYEAFYEKCEYGAVVVRYAPGGNDSGDQANGDGENLCVICNAARKYRNRVLTVFCLPTECRKVKETMFENLGGMSLVELTEDLIPGTGEKARNYLKTLAKRRGIRPDKQLYAKLDSGDSLKFFRGVDLKEIFEEWYDKKLRTTVFSEYQQFETIRIREAKAVPKGSAIEILDGMIGLAEAKAVIHKALNFYKVQKLYRDKGISVDHPAMHMVFTGNPGTAKTTVARLFAQIMKDNRLLSKGDLYEVGRADLVGKYVGWTARMVKEKFQAARGSVLFIDEAYSLVDDRDGSYGDEAINTIVQEMENNRENMAVIFAGYPDKMEEFLNKNPGLRSRIAFHVPFHDYNTEELCDIAQMMMNKKGLLFTADVRGRLTDIFDLARQSPDFGNGRYVRNLLEQARMEQANRIVKMDPEEVTQTDLLVLQAEDFQLPAPKILPAKSKIGFTA